MASPGGGPRNGKCGCPPCSKASFFPEESFQSWSNYMVALKETPARFMERLTARSLDEMEIHTMRDRSQHQMKKNLTWWDLMWFGIGAVVGAGIFVLTGQEANEDAGPAVVVSFAVSGLSAMLSVFCYTEFAVEIPVAGGSFAYLRVELGDFVAFIAAGNILLEYVISGAAVARSWTSYFATLCNHQPNDFRVTLPNLSPDYQHLDPIAVVVTATIGVSAIKSTKGSSRFNYIASIIHVLIILFIIIAGLTKANPKNYSTFAPFGPRGIFQASAVLFFAYTGFDAVSTMAEETKNPAKDIPIGLVGSMSFTTLAYCLLAMTLCLMQPYNEIDKDAAFSVAFSKVGMDWAKYVVAAGALKGMTTVLLVNAVGQARYMAHIARTHMMPPWLAHVNEYTGTPVKATVVMLMASAIIALFTSLDVLANLLSISTLVIFTLVALALLVRRYYTAGVTTNQHKIKLVSFLGTILVSSTVAAACWGLDVGWIACAIATGVCFLATLGLAIFVPQARKPKVWGVPLVPWVPSASIFINIFLCGSIDKESFIRFVIWTAVLLVYYLFLGLHASYDAAKEMQKICAAENATELEEVEEREASRVEDQAGVGASPSVAS